MGEELLKALEEMRQHATELEAHSNEITTSRIIEKTPEPKSLFSKLSTTVTNYIKIGKKISKDMALYEMHGDLRNHWAARTIRWRPKSELYPSGSMTIYLHTPHTSYSTQEATAPALNIPPETWQRALKKAGYGLREIKSDPLTGNYSIVRGEKEIGKIEYCYVDELVQCPTSVNIAHEEHFEPVIKALFGYKELPIGRRKRLR